MKYVTRATSSGLVLAGLLGLGAGFAPSAGASGSSFPIYDTVKAKMTLATLHQTVKIPRGTFIGKVDSSTGALTGNLRLPWAATTLNIAGIGVARVTVALQPTQPTTGKVSLSTFYITATSVFNIRVISVKPLGLPVNLVGNHCTTGTPVTLNFSGEASPFPGTSGTVTGTYTIPSFAHCGAATTALTAAVSGAGNTFTAIMTTG